MPVNLTPLDLFSTPTAPHDDDDLGAASIQSALQTYANRTEYLNERRGENETSFDSLSDVVDNLQQACTLRFTAGSTTTAELSELTGGNHLGLGDYTLDDDTDIGVPATGVYLISFGAELSSDSSSDNIELSMTMQIGGSGYAHVAARRWSTTTGHSVYVYRSVLAAVNAAAPINFLIAGTGTVSIENNQAASIVNLLRIG